MIIGIDLGTTNSLVSYFSEDGPKIIKNRLGENLTPSVVSVDENGQVYVGKTALERKQLYPLSCAAAFKRSMGTGREYELSGKKYKAEELSSFVLRSLKEDAESFLGQEVTEAVISVPAYFNDAQRRATKRAGELAGLKVERMISEPTAAAISYGLHQKSMGTKFLVFDLGGGTFDVSVLELYQNIMEVRAVAGDNYLGGEDFNECLSDMFCEKLHIKVEELNVKEREYLKFASERAKIEFSDNDIVTMRMRLDGEIKELEISAAEYEKACQPLLARLKKPIERSLRDANLKLKDIDEIILVGGSTKMPIVRRFVSRLFSRFPNLSINPDEVVALGAGIQGAMKERNELIKEMIMTDVCPFTLGTDVVVGREGYREPGHFYPIIERNTVIPVSRTERMCTASDDQTIIKVDILQGESRFSKNNLLLGSVEVPVPRGKAGAEEVDITFTYDINSILEVEVKVVSTGEKRRIVLKKEDCDLSDEEIDKRFRELSALKIHPRDQEENRLVLLQGERLYEECTGDLRMVIDDALSRFDQALNSQKQSEIERTREELKAVIAMAEESKWDD